jgi:hypothetical protein
MDHQHPYADLGGKQGLVPLEDRRHGIHCRRRLRGSSGSARRGRGARGRGAGRVGCRGVRLVRSVIWELLHLDLAVTVDLITRFLALLTVPEQWH